MKEIGSFGNDHNSPKKQPPIPNKYKEALRAQRVEDAQNALEAGYNADALEVRYNAEHAQDLAQEMYEEMRVYFHEYNLKIEIREIEGKSIPVINAESFEIARYAADDFRYSDNLGQSLQEASIVRIVERMGDSPEFDATQEGVKNQLSKENIEQQMIDDAEVMAKVVLLFDIPEQIEILPPTDMYRHNQDIEDNEALDYNYDLEDDDSQDGEVLYIDAKGKEYKIAGPLLDHQPKTPNTPSSELSLKTIMVPGKGIIMYNVSKKYFELTTFEHKTIRATSIENLKKEFDKLD
jgi:hypothetical protein